MPRIHAFIVFICNKNSIRKCWKVGWWNWIPVSYWLKTQNSELKDTTTLRRCGENAESGNYSLWVSTDGPLCICHPLGMCYYKNIDLCSFKYYDTSSGFYPLASSTTCSNTQTSRSPGVTQPWTPALNLFLWEWPWNPLWLSHLIQNLSVALFGWMSSCERSKLQLRLEACKVAVSCTVPLCVRELPRSARWLPGSQWLFCFHSCYISKTFAVSAGQQHQLPWSSRGETGGGCDAASIRDRWLSDSCVAQ